MSSRRRNFEPHASLVLTIWSFNGRWRWGHHHLPWLLQLFCPLLYSIGRLWSPLLIVISQVWQRIILFCCLFFRGKKSSKCSKKGIVGGKVFSLTFCLSTLSSRFCQVIGFLRGWGPLLLILTSPSKVPLQRTPVGFASIVSNATKKPTKIV